MDLTKIDDNEILYRAVRKSTPDSFIDGKPTAALFMDDNGASVDRDGERKECEIVNKIMGRFQRYNDYNSCVRISAKACRSADTYPNPTGNKKNKYHAEIHDSENEVKIGLLKAIILANMCKEVTIAP